MVFDRQGGFYFTDFRGYSTNLLGGVYYVSADFESVTPIIRNLAVANGVSLSTDEKVLWVTETNANRLHRIELMQDRTTIAPFGASVPYHFTGHLGPDSCCIDSENNLRKGSISQVLASVELKEKATISGRAYAWDVPLPDAWTAMFVRRQYSVASHRMCWRQYLHQSRFPGREDVPWQPV